MNRKKNAAKTIINCMSHSGENRETVSVDGVTCKFDRPDRYFYSFAGMACSEVYSRRSDCFMTVIPSFSVFLLIWITAGVLGIFFYPLLAVYSGGCVALFCLATLTDKLIWLYRGGVGPVNLALFNIALYRCKYAGKRVPVFKKYGVYTDRIVADANRRRNKLAYAISAMAASLIVVLCLICTGVAI